MEEKVVKPLGRGQALKRAKSKWGKHAYVIDGNPKIVGCRDFINDHRGIGSTWEDAFIDAELKNQERKKRAEMHSRNFQRRESANGKENRREIGQEVSES